MLSGNGVKTVRCSYDPLCDPLRLKMLSGNGALYCWWRYKKKRSPAKKQKKKKFRLQKTSVHYVLADKHADNQRRGQIHISMLAGDFGELLILWLPHSTTGLSNKSAKC